MRKKAATMFILLLLLFIGPCCHGASANDQKQMTACLNKIISLCPRKNLINVVNVGADMQLDWPVIVQKLNDSSSIKWFKFERSDIVIISCMSSSANLDAILRDLFTRDASVSPALATFLVITDAKEIRAIKGLFVVAGAFFIKHLLIVVSGENRIYTYNPYKYRSVNRPHTRIIHLGSCETLETLHFHKLPPRWPNSTLVVIANAVPPYVICPRCDEPGIELETMEMVAKKLRFKIDYVFGNNFTFWGVKIEDTYNGMFGRLQKRHGDVLVGVFHSKHREHEDFDMTMTYMEDGTYWVVPKAKELPHWKRIFLVFDRFIYSCIFVSASAILGYNAWSRRRDESFADCLLCLYQVLLELSVHRIRSNRTVIQFWIVACLVISTAFKSQMVDLMSRSLFGKQINSLKDIIEANLTLMVEDDFAKLFQIYANEYERRVAERYEYCGNPRICLRRTATRRDATAIDFRRAHEYYLPREFMNSHGDVLVHRIDKIVMPIQIHWYFTKGYPMFEQIDVILGRMKDYGIISHLYDKMGYSAQRALNQKRLMFSAHVLNLDKIQIAFVVWLLGCVVASLVFFGEVCWELVRKVRKM